MSTPIRFAIIGLDHWYTAIELAKECAAHPGIDLVGIADLDEAHARQIAGETGVERVTTDLQEFINDPEIDAIASMVSVDLNPDIVIAAAKAGKHILSVKPLARTLEEATGILNAVREAGVTFIPAETRLRDSALNQYLHDLVTSGKLGTLVSGNLIVSGGLPTPWPGEEPTGGWWVDPQRAPGGGWIDHSIYQIDLLRWLLGEEVVSVSGHAANLVHKDLGVEDYGHAVIEFEGGATFGVEDTWSGPKGAWRNELSLIGTEGAVSVDTATGKVSTFGVSGEPGWTHEEYPSAARDAIAPLIAAIRGEETVLGTIEDGWINLAVCRAFYDAAESKRAVTPEALPGGSGEKSR